MEEIIEKSNVAMNIIEAINEKLGTIFQVEFEDGYVDELGNILYVKGDSEEYKSLAWIDGSKAVCDYKFLTAKFYVIREVGYDYEV